MSGIMGVSRCGNCRFAKIVPQDLSRRYCWGVPPFPLQAALGPGGNVSVQFVRPVVFVSDDACALWKPRDAEQIERDAEDMRAVQEISGTRQ